MATQRKGTPDTAPRETKHVDVRVHGLDCEREAAQIRRGLQGFPGLVDLRINPGAAKVSATYDPALTSPEAPATPTADREVDGNSVCHPPSATPRQRYSRGSHHPPVPVYIQPSSFPAHPNHELGTACME